MNSTGTLQQQVENLLKAGYRNIRFIPVVRAKYALSSEPGIKTITRDGERQAYKVYGTWKMCSVEFYIGTLSADVFDSSNLYFFYDPAF